MSGDADPPEAPNPKHPEMTAEEAVIAKEEAVVKLLEILDSISDKIGRTKAEPVDIDLPMWESTFRGIDRDYEAFSTYIGISGDTGLGKTMLLNTMIDAKVDIAPSSQQAACTAAVCCFENHYPERGNSKYIAKITFKSKENVDHELASFFQEMKDLRDRIAIEGADEVTTSEEVRFHEQIKVISGWSGLDLAKVRELGLAGQVDEITGKCQSAGMLFNLSDPSVAVEHVINEDSPQKFLREVTPFVGCVSKSKRGQLRWPLVEHAKIWLPSPLLGRCPGLVLVDLPGQMDALDSRSQVARDFHEKLDKMLIVTPADRAQDNRTATELICADQIYDMEASGKLDDDSIAIIISKVDQLDWVKYVNTEADEDSISPSFASDMALYETKKEQLVELQEKIETLKADQNGCPEPVSGNCSSKRLIRDTSQPPDELRLCMNLRQTLEIEVKELFSRCLLACIRFRSRGSIESLQAYFDDVRNSARQGHSRRASTVLSVFPVSSKAQQGLDRKSPLEGFPDRTATGFAELEDWIVASTLSRRELHADNILYRCKVSFDAIEEWATDSAEPPLRLPRTSKPGIEQILKDNIKILKADFKNSEVNLEKFFKRLKPFEKSAKKDSDDQTINGFSNLIERFQSDLEGFKLHWSTYSACIRRQGLQFSTSHKPRKTHCWEARLYGHYWARKAHIWNHTFTKRISDYTSRLVSNAQERVTHHLNVICSLDSLPSEYKDAFRRVAYKAHNLRMEHQSQIIQISARFVTRVNKIRTNSRALMNGPMKEGYVAASQHRGSGMAKKQIQTMHDFASKNAERIIQTIGTEVRKQLECRRDWFKGQYKKLNDTLVRNIEAIEIQVVRDLCSGSQHRQCYSSEIKDLRSSLQINEIKDWNEYWSSHRSKVGSIRIPPCEEKSPDDTSSDEEKKRPKRATKNSQRARKAAESDKKSGCKGKKVSQAELEDECSKESKPEGTGNAKTDEEERMVESSGMEAETR